MRDYSKSVATKIHPLKRKVLNKQKLWKALEYSPSPNQLSVHNSTARFRVNVQGRRSGKSYSAAKEILPYILTPNTRTWIVGPTLDLADKIMREVKVDIITKLRLPIAYKKEISGAVHYMKLAGLNSEVSVKSADRPESLVGDGIDHLVVEEAAKIKLTSPFAIRTFGIDPVAEWHAPAPWVSVAVGRVYPHLTPVDGVVRCDLEGPGVGDGLRWGGRRSRF